MVTRDKGPITSVIPYWYLHIGDPPHGEHGLPFIGTSAIMEVTLADQEDGGLLFFNPYIKPDYRQNLSMELDELKGKGEEQLRTG